jgi:GDP-4-dehydro-6-deoxy-D-mannose reductase
MSTNIKKILITGVSGFVGQHLERELNGSGYETVGLSNNVGSGKNYIACDLTDQASVNQLDLSGVSAVIHLAGLAAVGPSFDQPLRYINDNSSMVINLCEAFLTKKLNPRIVVVSSGAVYDSAQAMPLSETSKTTTNSPYAISKLTVEMLAEYYTKRGLDIIVARPFNHIGPGQGLGFILPDLTKNALEALANNTPLQIYPGNTSRDYTDVRDVVKAYRLLATQDGLKNGIYNICSSNSVSRDELLADILSQVDPEKKITTSTLPTSNRPIDAELIVGNNIKISQATGWKPTIPLQQTVADYINSLAS